MPTFEHPPEWWISLANLTRWFYWPALSAIFSALALGSTIILATRSDRDRRRKEATYVRAAGYVLTNGAHLIVSALDTYDRRDADPRKVCAVLISTSKSLGTIEPLDEFKLSDFPTPETMLTFVRGRLAIRTALTYAEQIVNGKTIAMDKFRVLEQRANECFRTLDAYADAHCNNTHPIHDLAMSWKSLAAWLRTTWTRRPRA